MRYDLPDGKRLEIKLNKASLAEHLICLKLARHVKTAILELNEMQKNQRQKIVDNFLSETREKLRCQKQK
jgi:hypothetical protein